MTKILHFTNYLLHLIGIKPDIITAIVHNNYIVYCRSTDKYYNLLPIKVNDKVWKYDHNGQYKLYQILEISINNQYRILDEHKFYNSEIVNGDCLYKYQTNSKLEGYISGIHFIVTKELR